MADDFDVLERLKATATKKPENNIQALLQAGVQGQALEQGKTLLQSAEAGAVPEPQTYKGAAQFISKLEKKVQKKPEFEEASPVERQKLVQDELQAQSKESMSNSELLGRILVGFVPTLLGAAIGGVSGLGVTAGGAAGAEAGVAGLKSIEELKKAQREQEEKEQKAVLERLKLVKEYKKEAREEELKRGELKIKQAELGLKAKEIAQKGQQAPKGFEKVVNPETGEVELRPTIQKLPPDKVIALAELGQVPKLLSDLRSTVEANRDLFGPVRGRVFEKIPTERGNTVEAQIRNVRQTIGKLKEGGVLRAEDEIKYAKMLPNLSESPEVALNKIELVSREMNEKANSTIGALGKAGYDVSSFKTAMQPVPALPKVIQPKRTGISEAVAGEQTRPQRIMQNGIEYTLNPKTGQYE